MITDRWYQTEAVKAVEAKWAAGCPRPVVVLPTGSGKTVVFSRLIKRKHERPWRPRRGRSLVLAHRHELIEQAADKIRDVAPELSVGIVKAQRNETRADVIVASVQTLQRLDRRLMIADVDLIVVDEAHHAVAESYLKILAHYGAWGDEPPVGQSERALAVGFTATLVRSDEKALGDVWPEVAYVRSILEMVQAGFLVRPRGVRVKVDDLDLAGVKRSRGDFSEGDLGRAITESMAPELIAKAILDHASGPGDCGIIFAPTVDAARVIEAAVRDVGARTALVWGEMAPQARREALSAFAAGELDWLASVGVLTEGTDLPRARVAVLARPTQSRGLYVQMAGRVLRPYPGKSEALLLDVVGTTKMHSLMSPLQLFGEKSAVIEDKIVGNDEDLLDLGDDDESTEEPKPGRDGLIDYVTGPTVSHEVDLFRGSASDWLQTRAGIWFLPAGERFIAIVPGVAHGTWDVTAMHSTQLRTGQWVVNGIHDLSYAMAYAEGAVTAQERMTAARGRPWKLKKPTDKQVNLARKMGWNPSPAATSGEVSQMITTIIATRRIDPYIPEYARGR